MSSLDEHPTQGASQEKKCAVAVRHDGDLGLEQLDGITDLPRAFGTISVRNGDEEGE